MACSRPRLRVPVHHSIHPPTCRPIILLSIHPNPPCIYPAPLPLSVCLSTHLRTHPDKTFSCCEVAAALAAGELGPAVLTGADPWKPDPPERGCPRARGAAAQGSPCRREKARGLPHSTNGAGRASPPQPGASVCVSFFRLPRPSHREAPWGGERLCWAVAMSCLSDPWCARLPPPPVTQFPPLQQCP